MKAHLIILVFLLNHELSAGAHDRGRGRGIIGGRPVSANPGVTANMRRTVMIRNGAEGGQCSGIMIEGCILTAAHCIRRVDGRFANHQIFTGVRPTGEPAHTGNEIEVLGESRTGRDLAVIKVRGGLPRNAGITRANLATEAPARGAQAAIIGYGVNGTQETFNGDRVTYANVGEGIRRAGFSVVTGVHDIADGEGNRLGSFLRIIRARGGSSMMGQGDSGGPLFIGTTLHGIAVAAESFTNLPDERDPADAAFAGLYSPLHEHRERITAAMDRLRCADNVTDPMPAP